MAIAIKDTSDWKMLREQGLETVVDPMVVRCGELFLNGISNISEPNSTWELLSSNLHSVGSFFDALILNEKLPVFNYGDTFDMTLNFDQRVLARINDQDEVLHDIDVEYGPYQEVKKAALSELMEAYDGPHKIPQNMTNEVLSELSAAEYEWNPDIGELQDSLGSNEEKRLAGFLLGGLVFGGYAQQMESTHLLQPKRSRLFLAISLRAKSAGYQLEDLLFDDLKKTTNTTCADLPWTPTFFPYLLGKANTPMELLKEVIELRRSAEVVDYRQWLREVMSDWENNGKISLEKKRDVGAIAKSIDQVLGNVSSMPKVELKVTVADVLIGKPPGSIDFTPALQGLWGWVLKSLPGKRYRKLLTRAVLADHEYVQIDKRIKTVWNAG